MKMNEKHVDHVPMQDLEVLCLTQVELPHQQGKCHLALCSWIIRIPEVSILEQIQWLSKKKREMNDSVYDVLII